MYIKYNIKKFFGYYKNKPSVWIHIFQTDGVEYFCEVNHEILKDKIKEYLSKEYIKKIKIL